MNFVKINKPLMMKQGDTKNVYTVTLQDEFRQAVDLTGATVNFRLAGEKLTINKTATIIDATGGMVTFSFDDNDVTGTGAMDGELKVVYPNGDKETFPSNGYISFNIRANLLSRGEEVIQPSLITQYEDKIDEQDAKIGTISAKLPQLFVEDFTGASDEEKIQNAIDSAYNNGNEARKKVLLDNKDYSVAGGIIIKEGVELVFNYGTRVLINGSNYNLFELEKDASLVDAKVFVNDTQWDGAVVYLDGKHKYYNSWYNTIIRNLKVVNWSESNKGTGIHCKSSNDGDEISFVNFENPKLVGLKNGVVLESIEPASSVSYVTANRFTNITIEDCVTMVDIKGAIYGAYPTYESSANHFTNMQLQLSPATTTVISCSSQFNKFDGMVWDDYHVPDGIKLIKFTSQSSNNDMTGLYFQNKDRLEDLGTNNRTHFDVANQDVIENVYNPIVSNEKRQMIGNQDDIFVGANNEYTVTQTSSHSNWYGDISNLFTTQKDFVGWNDVTANDPVVFEVDMTAQGGISSLDLIGLTFRPGLQYPQLVKIEVATSNGGAYSEIFSTTNNQAGEIVVNYYASTAWRIRVTLGDSEDQASTRRIRVSRLWGTSISREGNAYVRTTGDTTIAGDNEFHLSSHGQIYKSPDGSRWKLSVANDGTIVTTKL